jgi:asparagine synthase (glutamine-hydrolysing)
VIVALSGGMDSTSIAAILSQLQKEHHSGFNIQLITEMRKLKNYESKEYPFAKEVADFLSLSLIKWNNSGMLLKMDFATIKPITVLAPDTLPNTAKMYYGHGRVIFTGNGSDELFATTPLNQYLGKEPLLDIIKGAYQHRKRHKSRPPFGFKGSLKKYFGLEHRPPLPNIVKLLNSDIKKKLDIESLANKIYEEENVSAKQRHFTAAQRLTKPKWNIEGTFLNADFSLAEYRDPFLDRRVIEFVFSLPELGWVFDKYLLRRAMKEKLPESIITRTKQPVYGYQDAILQEEENQWIHQWKPSGILKPYIDTYKANNTSLFEKQEYAFHNLRLIMLENWLKILKSSN